MTSYNPPFLFLKILYIYLKKNSSKKVINAVVCCFSGVCDPNCKIGNYRILTVRTLNHILLLLSPLKEMKKKKTTIVIMIVIMKVIMIVILIVIMIVIMRVLIILIILVIISIEFVVPANAGACSMTDGDQRKCKPETCCCTLQYIPQHCTVGVSLACKSHLLVLVSL